jgi:benzoyl-CoA reductase subunit BamC
MKKQTIKEIKVNVDKCTGCRSCEMACSAFHSVPRYSSLNPARSRIRVFVDETRDVYVPIRGGNYTQAECNGRNQYKINAKEYAECAFCAASCPSRDWFKEPDSGLPLQCDMCENTPPLPEPMCVQACKFGALTYEMREEEGVEEKVSQDEIETGLEALTNRYGMQKVMDTVARMSRKG